MKIQRMIIQALITALFSTCAPAQTTQTQPSTGSEVVGSGTVDTCVPNRKRLLALDFQTFEQDFEQGWQSIARVEECRLAAADLISEYHANLIDAGNPVYLELEDHGKVIISDTGMIPLLYWHEGQLRAFDGSSEQTQQAIRLFRLALNPEGQNVRGWNQYVLGSIAFLQKDLDQLIKQRDALALKYPGTVNLGVLDSMIACFQKSYADAYSSAECNRRPQR